MQIDNGSTKISLEQFQALYPEIAKVLTGFFHPKIHLNIMDWSLTHEDLKLKPFKLNLAQDLSKQHMAFRKTSPYKENLAKALGFKSKPFHVCDLSGGLMKDSIMMLAMGIKVTTFERHPLLAAMIMHELPLEGLQFYPHEYQQTEADVYYFDPMYEDPNHKAAPKGGMQLLREMIGEDHDAREFAQKFIAQGKKLVVKRPKKSALLLENPHHQIVGKSTRYDVYHP